MSKKDKSKPIVFSKDDDYKGLAAYINNTSHLKRAIDIEKNLGTKVYLACGNNNQIESLLHSQEHLINNNLL